MLILGRCATTCESNVSCCGCSSNRVWHNGVSRTSSTYRKGNPPSLSTRVDEVREKRNVMIVIQRKFQNRSLFVQFVQHPHNQSTVSYGLNLTFSLNFSVSTKKKSPK